MANMPLHRLPLSRDHQCLRLQWARERCPWRAEWQNVVFSNKSSFNMPYNDDRICVRRYAGECNLRACILQRHRGPTPSVMFWGAIGYNMRSFLLRIEGNLNSYATLVRFYSPRYCPSFRQLHLPHFSRIMPGHTWQGLCKPSSKDDWYRCFPGLHVRQTCRPSNMSGIWLVGDLFVRVLQHLLLMLCGLAYKLCGGTFPRKLSRASLIPCHDAKRLSLQRMETSHHIEITCSQIMYSSVILILCLLPCT